MQTQYGNKDKDCEEIPRQGKGFHNSRNLTKVVAIYIETNCNHSANIFGTFGWLSKFFFHHKRNKT